jgi:hypothetical protein
VIHPHFPSNRTGWGCIVIAPQSLGGVRRLIVALLAERLVTGQVTNMPRSVNHPSSSPMGLAHVNECHVIVSPPRRFVGGLAVRMPSVPTPSVSSPSGSHHGMSYPTVSSPRGVGQEPNEHVRPFAGERTSGVAHSQRVPAARGLHYAYVSPCGHAPGELSGVGQPRSRRSRAPREVRVGELLASELPAGVPGGLAIELAPHVYRSAPFLMIDPRSISERAMSSGRGGIECAAVKFAAGERPATWRVVGYAHRWISRRRSCGAARP